MYYAITVNSTSIAAIGSISAQKYNATQQTYDEVLWILNYAASHPGATIQYSASDMILHFHSDASYLSEPKAWIRAGGHYFLSNRSLEPTRAPNTSTTLNGPIHTISKIMSNIMSSAAEAEIVSTLLNGQEAVPINTTLSKLGHPQTATPIRVDNPTAEGFANNTIKQKRSKAIDMRFYWIQDRTRQKKFLIYWKPGSTKLGDYHTEHHPDSHHRLMSSTYPHPTTQLANLVISHILQGCVKSPRQIYEYPSPMNQLSPSPSPLTPLSPRTRFHSRMPMANWSH